MSCQHETEGVEGVHRVEVWLGSTLRCRPWYQLRDIHSDRIILVFSCLFSPQTSSWNTVVFQFINPISKRNIWDCFVFDLSL